MLPVGEKPHAGWIERLAFKAMDNVLKAGWTPERATPFYGGISESEMRGMVAYARRHGLLEMTKSTIAAGAATQAVCCSTYATTWLCNK